jgi:hypothetical protein
VRGEVWGINAGWAVSPTLGSGSITGLPIGVLPPGALPPGVLGPRRRGWVSLKPGRYTAIVRITGRYRKLFGIAAGRAAARVGLRVLYSRPLRVRPPVRAFRGRKAEDARDARGSRAAAIQTTPAPASMPNLVATPAWGIAIRRQGRSLGGPVGVPVPGAITVGPGGGGGRRRGPLRDVLTFSATIWNAGPAPFSIEGFRRPHSDVMDAYEYFFDSAGNVVGRAPAGTLQYDSRPGHDHWHLRQLASMS